MANKTALSTIKTILNKQIGSLETMEGKDLIEFKNKLEELNTKAKEVFKKRKSVLIEAKKKEIQDLEDL